MVRASLEIGSGPIDEDLAREGSPGFAERNRIECEAFIEGIRRYLGREPEGARLMVRKSGEWSRPFNEVVCTYAADNTEAEDYARRVQRQQPARWEECGITPEQLYMGRRAG